MYVAQTGSQIGPYGENSLQVRSQVQVDLIISHRSAMQNCDLFQASTDVPARRQRIDQVACLLSPDDIRRRQSWRRLEGIGPTAGATQGCHH